MLIIIKIETSFLECSILYPALLTLDIPLTFVRHDSNITNAFNVSPTEVILEKCQ